MQTNWFYRARETALRLVILMIGLTIAHLGVTLFLLSNMGADPFNVLVQGVFLTLSRVFSWPILTHGNTHIAICVLIIAILLLVDRSYVKLGTVVCMICGGPIIDLFTALLTPVYPAEGTLPVKIALLALGCVILALGMSLVIKSNAGTGPNDLVAVVIADKLHAKFGLVRILADAAFVLFGFLLGGAVGVGTLICAGLVGPVAGFFLPYSGRIVQRIMRGVTVSA